MTIFKMGTKSLITIVVLSILSIVVIVLNVFSIRKNKASTQRQVLLPFTARIDPTTGNVSPFTNAQGDAQISCPAGTSVNIVGAFFNVFDPYNECTNDSSKVSGSLSFICDPSQQSPTACTDSTTCPTNTSCNGSGFCQLTPQDQDTVCPRGTSIQKVGNQYYCLNPSICGYDIDASNGGLGIPNPYCMPSSKEGSMCAIRDASAGVAKKCDGRQSCPDLTISDFGDLPCSGNNMEPQQCLVTNSDGSISWKETRSGYCGLPYMPGYQGGVPDNSSTQNPDPGSSNIGYVMHGIYTCS